jgi:hypothetical protein
MTKEEWLGMFKVTDDLPVSGRQVFLLLESLVIELFEDIDNEPTCLKVTPYLFRARRQAIQVYRLKEIHGTTTNP